MSQSYFPLSQGGRGLQTDQVPQYLDQVRYSNDVLQDSVNKLNASINANEQARMANAKRAGDVAMALSSLSKTALKYTEHKFEEFKKAELAKATADHQDGEKPDEEPDETESKEFKSHEGSQRKAAVAATEASTQGAPPAVQDAISTNSPWYDYFRNSMILGSLAQGAPRIAEQLFAETNGTFADRRAAGREAIRQLAETAKDAGFSEQQIYAHIRKPGMEFISKNDAAAYEAEQQKYYQDKQDLAFTGLLNNTITLQQAQNMVRHTKVNGRVLGDRGSLNYFTERLKTIAGTGDAPDRKRVLDIVDRVRAELNQDGKPLGELTNYDMQFDIIENAAHAGDVAEQNRREQSIVIDTKASTRAFLERMGDTPLTQADVDAEIRLQKEQNLGQYDKRLDDIRSGLTVEGIALERQKQQVVALAEAGLLNDENLSQFHYTIQLGYSNLKDLQVKSRAENGNFKGVKEELYKTAQANATTMPDGSAGPTVRPLSDRYFNIFQRRLSANLIAASSEAGRPLTQQERQAAFDNARQITVEELRQWTQDPANRTKDGYVIYPPTREATSAARSYLQEKLRIDNIIATRGVQALHTPNALLNRERLATIGTDITEIMRNLDHDIEYMSEQYGLHPIQLINYAREALDLPPIEPTPAMKRLMELPAQISKPFYSKTNNQPFQNVRNMSAIGSYEPTFVPGGHGQRIQRQASKYNLHPGLVAGQTEKESSFVATRESNSGAVGLLQVMQDGALKEYNTVNGTSLTMADMEDPDKNLEVGTWYLRYVLDNYVDGDLNMALYAYNYGIGNVRDSMAATGQPYNEEKYDEKGNFTGWGKNLEAYEYVSKTLKFAAKYGYTDALRDPLTHR